MTGPNKVHQKPKMPTNTAPKPSALATDVSDGVRTRTATLPMIKKVSPIRTTRLRRNNNRPLKHRSRRHQPAVHSTGPENGVMFDRDDWSGHCYALDIHGAEACCVDLLNVSSSRQVVLALHGAGISVHTCSSQNYTKGHRTPADTSLPMPLPTFLEVKQ